MLQPPTSRANPDRDLQQALLFALLASRSRGNSFWKRYWKPLPCSGTSDVNVAISRIPKAGQIG